VYNACLWGSEEGGAHFITLSSQTWSVVSTHCCAHTARRPVLGPIRGSSPIAGDGEGPPAVRQDSREELTVDRAQPEGLRRSLSDSDAAAAVIV
jgi:hypothetical protein